MSKRPETSWSLWCDFPDCHHQFEAGEGYTVFGDGWDPDEIVSDSDGWLGVTGLHFCSGHPMVWASDYADGEPTPAASFLSPPYLLIHDGDTNKPDDDCKVTLVEWAKDL